MAVKSVVPSSQKHTVKVSFNSGSHHGNADMQIEERQRRLGEIRKLPLFMQQLALAIAALEMFRDKKDGPTHKTLKLWEAADSQEHNYWSPRSGYQRCLPLVLRCCSGGEDIALPANVRRTADLSSTELKIVAIEARAAFDATPRGSDADFCIALARAARRFALVPGANGQGLSWTIGELGRLIKMPNSSRGCENLEVGNTEKQCQDQLQQARAAMEATPLEIQHVCEGTRPPSRWL